MPKRCLPELLDVGARDLLASKSLLDRRILQTSEHSPHQVRKLCYRISSQESQKTFALARTTGQWPAAVETDLFAGLR